MDSLWINSTYNIDNFETLNEDLDTDICIIGAGIFGITCAYYLSKLGFKVVVLEKDTIGKKTTGNTTGKITSLHGLFYDYLISSYGEKFAKDYLYANEEAIKNIKDIIDKENIKCDFEYQNNYVYTTSNDEVRAIKKEVQAVNSLDFNCEYVTKCGLPFDISGAICFKNQAQFNPLKYLFGLCDCIEACGNKIYTNSTAFDVKVDGDYYLTYVSDYVVKSKYVIMASHYPFINFPGLYFTKMYQSTSYVIAIDPKKSLFNGMYINFTNPIFSYRTAKYMGKNLLLIAGADHKTGQSGSFMDTYGILENEARKFYPNCDILFSWNTRDCISLDKIPYVGSYSTSMPNMFIATGFKKWGMTLSNVAANIIVDKICKKPNRYDYVFYSNRLKPVKNIDEFKNVLVQSTNSLVINKIKHVNTNFDDIKNNSGGIIEINGQKVGIYKDDDGKVFAVKPICTHLGCLLSWNDVDKTWDCPCHGSRFDFRGKNLYEPAFKDLEVFDLEN